MGLEHVLVAGGGSGGHVFPALAVAEHLRDRGWQMSWLGRPAGMERDLVEPRGWQYHGLPAQAVVGRSLGQRTLAMGGMAVSVIRARRLIQRIGAGLVLGTGGFVSGPGVMGAALANRPVVLLEPNAVPGAANCLLSRWASVAAVAARSTEEHLRCPVEDTGVPIRAEFATAYRPADLDGPMRVLVLGGSQGARQLNELLPPAIEHLAAARTGLQVTHQVGSGHLEEARAAYAQRNLSHVELSLVPFVEDVGEAMSRAQLVISRAGAITLAEICAVGRAALLLPLSLAGAHQLGNARRLVEHGAAELVEPAQASVEGLTEVLHRLTESRDRLREMGEAALRLSRPRAARDVADLVERVARKA